VAAVEVAAMAGERRWVEGGERRALAARVERLSRVERQARVKRLARGERLVLGARMASGERMALGEMIVFGEGQARGERQARGDRQALGERMRERVALAAKASPGWERAGGNGEGGDGGGGDGAIIGGSGGGGESDSVGGTGGDRDGGGGEKAGGIGGGGEAVGGGQHTTKAPALEISFLPVVLYKIWLQLPFGCPAAQVPDVAFEKPAVSSSPSGSWTKVQYWPSSPGPDFIVNSHAGGDDFGSASVTVT
jgi:hypothetical protein